MCDSIKTSSSMEWLDAAGKLAKNQDTRNLVLQDPSFLSRVGSLVNQATAGPTSTPSNDGSAVSTQGGENVNGASFAHPTPPMADRDFAAPLDTDTFHSPCQASPEAASALSRAFLVLRDSCAGCRGNQDALRESGLADAALAFAVDQASFACGAVSQTQPPGTRIRGSVASADSVATATTAAVSAPAEVVRPGVNKHGNASGNSRVWLAVRAALQFACNYCVGNEENQALLWVKWFPRGFMELVNGLKTDRRLLCFAVALIHNCCLPQQRGRGARGGRGRGRGGGGGLGDTNPVVGQERLRRLTAHKAFCCLLMKVTPHNPAGNTPVQAESDISAASSNGASSSSTETTTPSPAAAAPSKSIDGRSAGDDPAAEWLYLLFCRFVQEGLSSDVYDAVGIRAPGRPPVRHRDVPGEEQGGRGIAGDTAVKMPGDWHGGTDEDEEEEEEAAGGGAFFFPVTPEQLVVLNLAEIAAGDELVTGGERPSTSQQRQACHALVTWLVDLLSSMPRTQSLNPPPGHRGDGDTERARRCLREEARSAALRALATLLAEGDGDTRCAAAVAGGGGAGTGGSEAAPREQPMAPTSTTAPDACATLAEADVTSSEGAFVSTGRARTSGVASVEACGETGSAAAVGITPPPPPQGDELETRLVPLCLLLLRACGGAAEPKADDGRRGAAEEAGSGSGHLAQGVGRLGVPAGRKAELLKVIGNACFRCRASQDLVREVGGLTLVLNHCAVDGGNPLLREYALLAVRNLCEDNPANQASIAALQPQGPTPGMEEALADMGLEGHVDPQGNFRVGPRPV